jgi:hypothetical protein
MMLSTLFLAAVDFASTVSAAPISDNHAKVARATLEKSATWNFDGYSHSQACWETGNTSAGGSGRVGCSPIDSRGVTRFS